MTRILVSLILAGAAFAAGLFVGGTEHGRELRNTATRSAVSGLSRNVDLDVRMRVLLERPELMRAIAQGGAFGGRFSRQVATNMFGRTPEAIDDARDLTEIQELAPRTWLVRMPIVNAAVFETDAGLVIVDTGMAPAGPALLEAVRSVSNAPIHTVVFTHGHVDHAFGTWALAETGEDFEVVAHEALLDRFERYIRLRGSVAKYMSQPVEQMPARREDLVWPTRTFAERLELVIGGETFVLQHHRGETDDQLYVWVPGRRVLASADYYQGFLPNAGNGKRVQRYVEEWAVALREMAALQPALLLPAHGDPLTDAAEIERNFLLLAEALQWIVDRTVEGLNQGLRKDQIFARIALPEHLAGEHSLREQYVSVQDVSKMVIRRYTGWWDDHPSHWTPAPAADTAAEVMALAGGLDRLAERARNLMDADLLLASQLADWAILAAPDDAVAQELVMDVYAARILAPGTNTQEMLAYLDAMTEARLAQLSRDP